MTVNRIIVIFGIILVIFIAIVLYQFSGIGGSNKSSNPAFKTSATVTIDNHTFKAGVATTPQEQEQGLSGVPSLADDQGMLFLFDQSKVQAFWMKEMKFPLDIIFVQNDKIITIAKNQPAPSAAQTESPPLIYPSGPINKVLEINAGLSDKYKFKEGDTVKVEL